MNLKRAASSHSLTKTLRGLEITTCLSTLWSTASVRALPTIVSFVIFFALTVAQANTAQCEFLFASPNFSDVVELPTVEISGQVTASNGETFFRLRKLKPSLSWGSTYSVRGYDNQGDPTWGFHFFGPELAEVMGYSWSENGDLLVPTPATLNRRIAIFNTYLLANNVAPIPISFYLQGKPLMETFLRGWAVGRALPISAGLSTHTIHDISFHYPNILLAPEIADVLQVEAGLSWYWLRITRSASHSHKTPKVVADMVRKIDGGSTMANRPVGTEFSAEAHNGATFFFQKISDPLRDWRAGNASPLQIFELRHRLDRIFHPHIEQHYLNYILAKHPDWNRPLSSFGIASAADVLRVQAKRSVVLRQAATDFLKEREAR